jgi:hypothetical protein
MSKQTERKQYRLFTTSYSLALLLKEKIIHFDLKCAMSSYCVNALITYFTVGSCN